MTLLLLAGTGEARALARQLAYDGIRATASLAGATRDPAGLHLPTRSGGFGGEAGFRAYLRDHGITRVVDATHPFAQRITARSARVCAEMGLPYLYVLRPPWTAQPGDHWIAIDREEDAAAHVQPGQTVFLGTGRQTLDRFANLAHATIICRQIDPPTGPFPFPNGRFLVGRPPFPVAAEITLFRKLRVDWLVVKNAGGGLSRSKLDAARQLGLPVLMIIRPPPPQADTVATVEDALTWIAAR